MHVTQSTEQETAICANANIILILGENKSPKVRPYKNPITATNKM
jgi:hypothetical protein